MIAGQDFWNRAKQELQVDGTLVAVKPSWPSLENILPGLKTVLPNADFVIEGYVDPRELLRDEGPFGDHTGYYTLPEPYPVFHVTAIWVAHATRVSASVTRRNFCRSSKMYLASRQTPQASRPRYPLHRQRGPHPACRPPSPIRWERGWG